MILLRFNRFFDICAGMCVPGVVACALIIAGDMWSDKGNVVACNGC